MKRAVRQDFVEKKIISIRNISVILDSDVAELYGVNTKQVNQAVNRNLEKFPSNYVLTLTKQEKEEVVTNCDHLQHLKFSPNFPNAFTESGLYMLATILKSRYATQTTISIIDTFVKVRAIGKTVKEIAVIEKDNKKKEALTQKTGQLISDLIIPESMHNREDEASIELNFAVVKFKYSVKRKQKNAKNIIAKKEVEV